MATGEYKCDTCDAHMQRNQIKALIELYMQKIKRMMGTFDKTSFILTFCFLYSSSTDISDDK